MAKAKPARRTNVSKSRTPREIFEARLDDHVIAKKAVKKRFRKRGQQWLDRLELLRNARASIALGEIGAGPWSAGQEWASAFRRLINTAKKVESSKQNSRNLRPLSQLRDVAKEWTWSTDTSKTVAGAAMLVALDDATSLPSLLQKALDLGMFYSSDFSDSLQKLIEEASIEKRAPAVMQSTDSSPQIAPPPAQPKSPTAVPVFKDSDFVGPKPVKSVLIALGSRGKDGKVIPMPGSTWRDHVAKGRIVIDRVTARSVRIHKDSLAKFGAKL